MQALALEAAQGLTKPSQPHAVLDDFLTRAQVPAPPEHPLCNLPVISQSSDPEACRSCSQVVGVDTTSVRAEAEALKATARDDWIVGRTGGGRTADAQGQTVTGQYRDDEIFWLRVRPDKHFPFPTHFLIHT
eukprot:COSAG03_NODE_1028_length_4992_cov_3.062334_2_plen_132_part_00